MPLSTTDQPAVVPVDVLDAATDAYAKQLCTCRREHCVDFFEHARVAAIESAYQAGVRAGFARVRRGS